MKIEGPDWILALALLFMIFCLGGAVGDLHGKYKAEQSLRQQAIEHGFGSYVCDPATGETEFRWKEADHAR